MWICLYIHNWYRKVKTSWFYHYVSKICVSGMFYLLGTPRHQMNATHTFGKVRKDSWIFTTEQTDLLPNVPNTPLKMHCHVRHRSAEVADPLPKKELAMCSCTVGWVRVYTWVCVCLCVCVHLCVSVCVRTCRGQGVDPVCLLPYSFWPRSLNELVAQACWLSSKPQGSFFPHPPALTVLVCTPKPRLSHEYWEPQSNPQVCTASTLPYWAVF